MDSSWALWVEKVLGQMHEIAFLRFVTVTIALCHVSSGAYASSSAASAFSSDGGLAVVLRRRYRYRHHHPRHFHTQLLLGWCLGLASCELSDSALPELGLELLILFQCVCVSWAGKCQLGGLRRGVDGSVYSAVIVCSVGLSEWCGREGDLYRRGVFRVGPRMVWVRSMAEGKWRQMNIAHQAEYQDREYSAVRQGC